MSDSMAILTVILCLCGLVALGGLVLLVILAAIDAGEERRRQ